MTDFCERVLVCICSEVKEIWAEEIDISHPMTNFHKIVPNLAHKVKQHYVLLSEGYIVGLAASMVTTRRDC